MMSELKDIIDSQKNADRLADYFLDAVVQVIIDRYEKVMIKKGNDE